MKIKNIIIMLACLSFVSCEGLKEQGSNVANLVKANASVDIGAGPKDGGYEGHVKASTTLFGYEPFVDVSAGVRKAPEVAPLPEPAPDVVEAVK